jgi:hypothetical protein
MAAHMVAVYQLPLGGTPRLLHGGFSDHRRPVGLPPSRNKVPTHASPSSCRENLFLFVDGSALLSNKTTGLACLHGTIDTACRTVGKMYRLSGVVSKGVTGLQHIVISKDVRRMYMCTVTQRIS